MPNCPINTEWPKVTYAWDNSLQQTNEFQLDCHSLLNILNIISVLVEMRIMNLEPESRNLEIVDHIQAICKLLHGSEEAVESALKESLKLVRELDGFLEKDYGIEADVLESNQLISEVSMLLKKRVDELLERSLEPDLWVQVKPDELEKSIKDFFGAVEKNAHGAYRIVFQPELHQKGCYLVELTLVPMSGRAFHIPPVLIDSIRDLAANARKYTAPGGIISIQLEQTPQTIVLTVSDNGKGIPENELRRVVEYGYRASNTRDVKTFGGGFGLTKALSVATRYQGCMHLSSKINEGTKVQIKIASAKE